jgi:hypothetical protein
VGDSRSRTAYLGRGVLQEIWVSDFAWFCEAKARGVRFFVLGMVFRRLRGWRSDIGLETSRTVVVLEVLLRNTIEGERGNGVVTTWSGGHPFFHVSSRLKLQSSLIWCLFKTAQW